MGDANSGAGAEDYYFCEYVWTHPDSGTLSELPINQHVVLYRQLLVNLRLG
jgi:hypothetical protein